MLYNSNYHLTMFPDFVPSFRSSKLFARESANVTVPSRRYTIGSYCGTVLVPPTMLVSYLRVFALPHQKHQWWVFVCREQKAELRFVLMQQCNSFCFPKYPYSVMFLVGFLPVQFYHFVSFSLDWLHVWERCVLCWHGVQECELLSYLSVGPCRSPTVGWGCPRQRVSEIFRFFGKNV